MLNSPVADSSNASTLFTQSDYNGLSMGKIRTLALEANEWMMQASLYLNAYASLPDSSKAALLDSMEVRMVMHTQNKKFASRANFDSLAHIALQFWNEAKELNPSLPSWTKIPATVAKASASDAKPASSRIREVSSDSVSDSVLADRGFRVGSFVKNSTTNKIYEIMLLSPNLKTVKCKLKRDTANETAKEKPKNLAAKIKSNAEKAETDMLEISRLELLDACKWSLYIEKKSTFLTSCGDPSSNADLVMSIVAGRVKEIMCQDFGKSLEDSTTLQLTPEVKLFANKAFKRENSFKLFPLTTNISVQPAAKTCDASWQKIGTTMKEGEPLHHVYMKSSTVLPKTGREPFISKFFIVHDTHDQSKINCMYSSKQHTLKILDFELHLDIHFIQNSKEIKDEDEIIVLKRSPVSEPAAAPAKKRRRS